MNISRRRNSFIRLVLYPALVQGEGAVDSIVKGIEVLDKYGVDVIIVGRGGGSMEDLWAFNEEKVARAIFACETPVISAVGHETDTTISDFVADLRAPTPSAAAELAVADLGSILQSLRDFDDRLNRLMEDKVREKREKLETFSWKLGFASQKAESGLCLCGRGGREAPHRSKRGEGRREADTLFCGRQAFCPCGRKRVRGTEMAEQKEQTLEEIFGEMEGLLEALESREISLEDSFEKYKEGMALLKAAGEKIDTVEKAMLVLNDQGEADEF